MKSIREVGMLFNILNLIQDRSFDILCDIVDALMFGTGTVQSVLNRWGIKLDADGTGMKPNTITAYCNGLGFTMTIAQYSEIVLHERNGRHIDAIKAIRAATGYGLKDSKEFADFIAKTV